MKNQWTNIRCLGDENLIEAIEDYEEKGWEVFSIMCLGHQMVEHKISREQIPFPVYSIIVKKQVVLEITNGD